MNEQENTKRLRNRKGTYDESRYRKVGFRISVETADLLQGVATALDITQGEAADIAIKRFSETIPEEVLNAARDAHSAETKRSETSEAFLRSVRPETAADAPQQQPRQKAPRQRRRVKSGSPSGAVQAAPDGPDPVLEGGLAAIARRHRDEVDAEDAGEQTEHSNRPKNARNRA